MKKLILAALGGYLWRKLSRRSASHGLRTQRY